MVTFQCSETSLTSIGPFELTVFLIWLSIWPVCLVKWNCSHLKIYPLNKIHTSHWFLLEILTSHWLRGVYFIKWINFSWESNSTFTNVCWSVCPSVCLSGSETPQQLEIIILHQSTFILHHSSFILHSSIIHPSFILRLLSFSACLGGCNFNLLLMSLTLCICILPCI